MIYPLRRIAVLLALAVLASGIDAHAINIFVDYRYDNGPTPFFNTAAKKAPLEAAAARLSQIITSSLSASTLLNNNEDWRIGFTHPTLGTSFEVSPATSAADDALANCGAQCYAANEYRGPWDILANRWILYPGGSSLPGMTRGVGGTGTGLNFLNVFEDNTSHLNRNFRTSSNSGDLPVWGGSISFDNDGSTVWHYDMNVTPPAGSTDLYSIALHEIGHALGLSTGWDDWEEHSSDGLFTGPAAVAAYNADNGASRTNLEVTADQHWKDNAYDSYIFQNASPNYVGTVGATGLQDLLMEPIANSSPTQRRFELTNVDVAALKDVGWSVVPTIFNLPGDYNKDGTVNAADYVVWGKGATTGTYATWRSNFGEPNGGAGGSGVPEPSAMILAVIGSMLICGRRRGRVATLI